MRRLRALPAIPAGVAAWLVAAGPVAAHGDVPAEPPTIGTLLLGWTFEPIPTLGIVAALAWWFWAVGRVNAAHPANRVPRQRTWYFLAGLGAIAVVRPSTTTATGGSIGPVGGRT